jgi:hypothetical protein
MKQTALEYLEENLIAIPYSEQDFEYNNKCWNKAKEMESKQKGYSEDQVKKAITNFYMNDFLLTEEKLTKVINDLKQQEQ